MYSSPRANVIHIRPKSQRYNTAAPQPAHFWTADLRVRLHAAILLYNIQNQFNVLHLLLI